MRGVFALQGITQTGTEISFAFPLASDPTPHIRLAGAAPNADCPGSVTAPAAAPGHLCIYEQSSTATTRTVFDPTINISDQASRFGAGLRYAVAPSGEVYGRGSWAVTAP